MTLATGTILNQRYRIVKLLGQGGFGAVYRAWDLVLKRPCAVKENLAVTVEAQRQFEREARILANLSHPNLPRVLDHFGLPDQGQYLVMDFVEGEDLQSMLNRLGALPEPQVLNWISQVCDALAYLHHQPSPVVHRDIKPANIKIRPDGRAILVDFGIAKVYDPRLSTTIGAKAITPGYSPPEQYGGGTTDRRSDVYALGATLYHLLTGQQPPESVQRLVGSVTTPLPRQLNQQISPMAEQAILKAIEVATDRRFQNVDELRQALTQPVHRVSVQPATSARPAPQMQPRPAQPPPTQRPQTQPPQAQLPSQAMHRRTPQTLQPVQKIQRPWWLWPVLGGLGAAALILVGGALIVSNMVNDADLTPTMAAALTETLPALQTTPTSASAAPSPTTETFVAAATSLPPTSTPLPPTPTSPPPTDTSTPLPPTSTHTPPPPTNTYTPTPTPDTSGPGNAPQWDGGWANIIPENHMGQSFTAKSGVITAVSVGIAPGGSQGSDTLTLRILSADKNVLAAVSQSVSEGFDGWLRFRLPDPGLAVTPGATYLIELEDTGKIFFGWKYGANTYPGGSAIVFGADEPGRDFFFNINPQLRIIQPIKTLQPIKKP